MHANLPAAGQLGHSPAQPIGAHRRRAAHPPAVPDDTYECANVQDVHCQRTRTRLQARRSMPWPVLAATSRAHTLSTRPIVTTVCLPSRQNGAFTVRCRPLPHARHARWLHTFCSRAQSHGLNKYIHIKHQLISKRSGKTTARRRLCTANHRRSSRSAERRPQEQNRPRHQQLPQRSQCLRIVS